MENPIGEPEGSALNEIWPWQSNSNLTVVSLSKVTVLESDVSLDELDQGPKEPSNQEAISESTY